MKSIIIAIALSTACASAWAHDADADGHDSSHTHWWLELGDAVGTWYAGANVTQSTVEDLGYFDDGSLTQNRKDDKATGTRLFGGMKWRYFGVELGYWDAGEASAFAQSDGSGSVYNAGPQSFAIELGGFDISLMGRLPIGEDWALFAKAGLFRSGVEERIVADLQCCGATTFSGSDDSTETLWGFGVERALGNWRLVAAYQVTQFEDVVFPTEIDLESLSVGVAYAWGPSAGQ